MAYLRVWWWSNKWFLWFFFFILHNSESDGSLDLLIGVVKSASIYVTQSTSRHPLSVQFLISFLSHWKLNSIKKRLYESRSLERKLCYQTRFGLQENSLVVRGHEIQLIKYVWVSLTRPFRHELIIQLNAFTNSFNILLLWFFYWLMLSFNSFNSLVIQQMFLVQSMRCWILQKGK